jgi:O-antigen ligase
MIKLKHLAFVLVALTWFEGSILFGHRLIILYGLLLAGIWGLLNFKKIVKRDISFTRAEFYLLGGLFLFWGWEALSLAWAGQITEVSRERVFNIAAAIGFTVILLDQFRREEDWTNVYKILAVVGIVSSLLVFQEAYTGAAHRAIGYISPDPNYTAMRITILLPLLYFWAKTSRNAIKLPLLAGILIAILAVVSTGSRAGMLTFVIIALFILFYELRNKSVRTVSATFVALFVIFIIVANVAPEPMSKGFERFDSLIDVAKGDISLEQGRISQRYILLVGGMKMFADNPLLGVGAGNFQLHSPDYGAHKPLEAHNTYIEVAGELGAVGIIIFGGLIIFTLKNFKAVEETGAKNQHDAFIIGAKIAFISVLINFLFLTAFTDRRFYLLMAFAVSMLGGETISLKEFTASIKKRVLRL